ncbi:ESF1 homolog isoform 1-T3 [Polymixia lowei]
MSSKKKQGEDERFLRVQKDPRFWEMPEKERKVKIDKRFKSMFHDKRFQVKYTVDKRGRPINHTSKEDLKRFYNLSDSEDDEEEGARSKKGVEGKKKKKKIKAKLEGETVAKDAAAPTKGKTLQDRDGKVREQPVRGVRVIEQDDDDEEDDEVQQSVEEDDDVEPEDGITDGSEEEEEDDTEAESGSDEEESGLDSEEDSDSGPDLARGKGNVETSSDEDEEEDEVDAILRREEEEIEHDWGDLCKDAQRTEEVSARLAVCNMDWDRMKAKDLLALFNSFKPKGGVVLSVKVYPSQFGKERMKVEETQGPLELVNLPDDPDNDTEEEKVHREKLRDYQFKRLKYYYAVVECDSSETATKIYEECDGFEYESSCSILDLRFIPDDVTFDEEPKDMATDVDLSVYTPKLFTSSATATSKVELTWDETDHDRVTAMNRKFNKNELLDMDFNAYLASSSEEEEDEEGVMGFGEQESREEGKTADDEQTEETLEEEESKPQRKMKSAEQISKYRQILKTIQEKDEKLHKDKDMEMEITWVPGLRETTEQLVKKKMEGRDQLTPWEDFLEKKRDKKKLKKAQRKQGAAESDLSDDELPPDVDLNDPFFSEELGSTAADMKKKMKGKKTKKAEEERTVEEEEELQRQKAEMALLMEDEDEDDVKRKHFNYDKIVELMNLSKRKRKKLQKQTDEPLEEDRFQVDVKDPRFQAMFTSHLFNLDPSDPNYKKTKGTQSILAEKQRRREEQQRSREEALRTPQATPTQEAQTGKQEEAEASAKKPMDPGLSLLVKSIKNKTEQFQARKKQKTM